MVLYSASGNLWPLPQLITISFMPDGTNLGGPVSNMQSVFNGKSGLMQTGNDWKTIIEKAAQSWAAVTNINFAVVTDNGAALGSAGYQQGDPNFGDIRIGGYNFNSTTLAQAFMPPPVNNYSIAGDIEFNTGQSFNVGSTYDLYTVAVHEIGHALGLYHSGVASAEMYSSYNGVKTALTSDDISGIQSVYGGVRKADSYEGTTGNGTTATATNLTTVIGATTLAARVSGDITTTTDLDYYKVVIPTGTNGTFQLSASSAGISLLAPTLSLLNSSGTVLKTASVSGALGGTASITYTGVTAGQTYYVEVSPAVTTVFGTGAYSLTTAFGTTSPPGLAKINTGIPAGSPMSSGGGIAVKLNSETLVNTTTAGTQSNSVYNSRYTAMDANGNSIVTWESAGVGVFAQRFDVNGNKVGSEFRIDSSTTSQSTPNVAMDANGDFVIVWTSSGQDATGSLGIYAQRYNNQGVAQGTPFRVNTTVAGDQQYPAVAMDQLGNFTVTWTSSGQDGSGQGVYAQRYTSAGAAVGGETRVNTTTAGDQMISRIGMDPNGNAVITWTSNGQDGGGLGVYAQRYNSSGATVGGEFRVNTTTAGDQSFSSVACDAAGDFTVAWQSFGQDGSGWGVYAQRFNSSGVAQGSEFLVSTTTAGDQVNPTVSMDNGGDILIAWSYNKTASSSSGAVPTSSTTYWNVDAAQFTSAGLAFGAEFQLNTTTTSHQKNASLAMDSSGHVLVAWSGGNSTDSAGILSQRYLISFAGEASDGFYAQGDSNDPDQARGNDSNTPAPSSSGVSETSAGDQGSAATNGGLGNRLLNGSEDRFQSSGVSGTSHGAHDWSASQRFGHRSRPIHQGLNTQKPRGNSLKDGKGSLGSQAHPSRMENHPS